MNAIVAHEPAQPFHAFQMNSQNRLSAFSQMNKANRPSDSGGYRTWKKKEDASSKEKTVNPASFTEFPDLVKSAPKKTIFEGSSLAAKLKEAIAAEEEEAIQKRLKKGITPEMLLREGCVALPLKGHCSSTEPLTVPEWITDNSVPFVMPSFQPKTMKQYADERRWRRLGINPYQLNLNDSLSMGEEEEDVISLPSEAPLYEDHEEQFVPQEEVYGE